MENNSKYLKILLTHKKTGKVLMESKNLYGYEELKEKLGIITLAEWFNMPGKTHYENIKPKIKLIAMEKNLNSYEEIKQYIDNVVNNIEHQYKVDEDTIILIDGLIFSIKDLIKPLFNKKFLEENFIKNCILTKVEEDFKIMNQFNFEFNEKSYSLAYILINSLNLFINKYLDEEEYEIYKNLNIFCNLAKEKYLYVRN